MPVFVYKCPSCGKEKEILTFTKDYKVPDCGQCKCSMVKQIAPCTFSLKGGGWYSSGYTKQK